MNEEIFNKLNDLKSYVKTNQCMYPVGSLFEGIMDHIAFGISDIHEDIKKLNVATESEVIECDMYNACGRFKKDKCYLKGKVYDCFEHSNER